MSLRRVRGTSPGRASSNPPTDAHPVSQVPAQEHEHEKSFERVPRRYLERPNNGCMARMPFRL